MKAGEPQNKSEYDEIFTDGIKVFLSRSVDAGRVKIIYRRRLFGESLEAVVS